MNNVINFFENLKNIHIVSSIVIVLVSIILYKFIAMFLGKGEKKENIKIFAGKRSKTYLKLSRSLIRYIFIIITILILLQINGVDVSSVLAGVGILGVVIGLAVQDWLKDIIRGSTILSDHYFSVGDIVKYKDIEGKVLVIGLKSTKIQDIKTGYIKSIANRNIEEIDVVSNLVYVNIPMPYEVPVKKAEKVIQDIVTDIKNNNNVEDCKYVGVNDLSDSCIKYYLEIICKEQYKLQVRRDSLRSILIRMENNKIAIPYTQIDIHQK